MLDDAIGGEQSESESSLSDNLSYAEFLVSHHKKFMDHLQKAFAVSAGNAAAAAATATGASPGVLVNREDLIDVALAETALDDFNERNNYTASVIFTELADDISKSSGFFHAGNMTNEEYEQFLADLWVGIVLTLMVLSCVCCMCSCLLYHKFQQWKRSVLENRTNTNPEAGDNESLPSYTIASGLPSYEEALEQLKTIKTNSLICSALSNHITPNSKAQESAGAIAPVHHPPPSINDTPMTPNQPTSPVAQSTQPGYATSASMARLSVVDLFQIYKNNNSTTDSLSKT